MQVKLISYTTGNEGSEFSTVFPQEPEEILVHIARVSSSREDKTAEPHKLINYLISHKHWSPFEMVNATVEIVTSRAIAQQILRHRSFSYQEFSQRYAEVVNFEYPEMRQQAGKNRQSSTVPIDNVTISEGLDEWFVDAEMIYKWLLEKGVARECARMVLPAAAQTTLYMQGTLRSWIHYLQIRDDDHVQKEHRDIAIEIKKILGKVFPATWKALGWGQVDQ
jgi:thymidylate synthase (FAD)